MSPIRSISLSLSGSSLLCRPTLSLCIYIPPPSPSLSLPRPSDWRLDVVPKSVDCHRLTLCIMGWKMPIILLPNVSAKFRACVRGRDTASFFVSNQRSLSIFCLCVFCRRDGSRLSLVGWLVRGWDLKKIYIFWCFKCGALISVLGAFLADTLKQHRYSYTFRWNGLWPLRHVLRRVSRHGMSN